MDLVGCKKDRKRKFTNKVIERFEKSLDIRSFVSVYTNLSLLLRVIFTKEQAFLFQQHQARSIAFESSPSSSNKSNLENASGYRD